MLVRPGFRRHFCFLSYRRLYPTLLAVEGTCPQERSDVTEQLFGIRLEALIGGSWTGLALANRAALGLSLAGAASFSGVW